MKCFYDTDDEAMIIVDVIVFLMLVGIAISVVKAAYRALLGLLKIIIAGLVILLFGLPALTAIIIERGFYKLKSRSSMIFIVGILNVLIGFIVIGLNENVFVAIVILFNGVFLFRLAWNYRKYLKLYRCYCFYTSKHVGHEHTMLVMAVAVGSLAWCSLPFLPDPSEEWVAVIYSITAFCLMLYVNEAIKAYSKLIKWSVCCFENNEPTTIQHSVRSCSATKSINHNVLRDEFGAEDVIRSIVIKLCIDQEKIELRVGRNDFVFSKTWYDETVKNFDFFLRSRDKLSNNEIISATMEFIEIFNREEAEEYIEKFNLDVSVCFFNDGRYFVHNSRQQEYVICVACHSTHRRDCIEGEGDNDWVCSDICKMTLNICEDVKKKIYIKNKDNALDLAIDSSIIREMSASWASYNKWIGNSKGGHGFVAEVANNKIDSILLKDTKILGDNNAKDGPDRSVNGQWVQSKYCQTPEECIKAAFDDHKYRYIDQNGQPMQVEVPKDKYSESVRLMEKRIRDGEVPGITDEGQAKNLVRAGHLTYDQAKNITKFGTMESLVYDAATGAVVALTAGGISFAVTAMTAYMRTGNKEAALKVAVIQSSKQAGKSLLVYISSQQLHRVKELQAFLNVAVDVNALPPSLVDFLKSGLGVSDTNKLQSVLHGTVVTTVVLVAIVSVPNIISLIRGRISPQQMMKNVTVVTAGVTGGVIGSVIGGSLGTMLAGPFGMYAGNFIGGSIGAVIAGGLTQHLMDHLIEDDAVALTKKIQQQCEILAYAFLLTDDEIKVFSKIVFELISTESLQIMYASENQMAYANFMLMPKVVELVQSRPRVYDGSYKVVSST